MIDCAIGKVEVLVVSVAIECHADNVQAVHLMEHIQRDDILLFSTLHGEAFSGLWEKAGRVTINGRKHSSCAWFSAIRRCGDMFALGTISKGQGTLTDV